MASKAAGVPTKSPSGSKAAARPAKELGAKALSHPSKPHASKTVAGQLTFRRLPAKPSIPLPIARDRTPIARPIPPPPGFGVLAKPTISPASPASPAKPTPLPPSLGPKRLVHTVTLEPVCCGRAHTLAVDKPMLVEFKAVTNWETSPISMLIAERTKPATCLALPCLTCMTSPPFACLALPCLTCVTSPPFARLALPCLTCVTSPTLRTQRDSPPRSKPAACSAVSKALLSGRTAALSLCAGALVCRTCLGQCVREMCDEFDFEISLHARGGTTGVRCGVAPRAGTWDFYKVYKVRCSLAYGDHMTRLCAIGE